ncbi:hypothetical protein ACHAWU_004781 [Discostella pseudostelligera]|uniref:Uncharacterized protein n=1 Tax=Discostella pseudostelligera TaxID=259834 RepID=A0ABD3N721_9STRA
MKVIRKEMEIQVIIETSTLPSLPSSTQTLNCHRSSVSPESMPVTTTTRRWTSPSVSHDPI